MSTQTVRSSPLTRRVTRRAAVLALPLLLMVGGGCATPTQFAAQRPLPQPAGMAADSRVQLGQVTLTGSLSERKSDPLPRFIAGFMKAGSEIRISPHERLNDGQLDVTLNSKFTPTGMTKVKYLPFIGSIFYVYGGQVLNYNWKSDVAYRFKDASGNVLKNDSFAIEGKHSFEGMKNAQRSSALAALLGAWVIAKMHYPSEDVLQQGGDTILEIAGYEVGKAIKSGKTRDYLIARTKARDGMDFDTYAEFLARKQRLAAIRKEHMKTVEQSMHATVAHDRSLIPLSASTVMVLGIGVDQYQSDDIPDLRFAARDCTRMVNLLKARYTLKDDQVMLLTNEEATITKIRRFITQNAAKMLDANDTFILYFSGHGAPDEDATSIDQDGLKKYLLLHNSDLTTLPLTGLSLDDIAVMLEDLPCKRVILLIDSCFAGSAGKKTLAKLKGVRISKKAYKNMADISGAGRAILAACSENQVSQENPQLSAGVFTHNLIQGLKGYADRDGDKKVNIIELYDYVSKQVSAQTGGAQVPVFRGTLDQNIVF